jgi:hypothetical protein
MMDKCYVNNVQSSGEIKPLEEGCEGKVVYGSIR